jgi:hypothetical protein
LPTFNELAECHEFVKFKHFFGRITVVQYNRITDRYIDCWKAFGNAASVDDVALLASFTPP